MRYIQVFPFPCFPMPVHPACSHLHSKQRCTEGCMSRDVTVLGRKDLNVGFANFGLGPIEPNEAIWAQKPFSLDCFQLLHSSDENKDS